MALPFGANWANWLVLATKESLPVTRSNSRNSTLRYRDRSKDLREIAAELDVRYILDGSVRRQAAKLRINAELIEVGVNRAIWSQRWMTAHWRLAVR